ncbi:helix-turn-helix domain-containing protein [Enterococcus faecium]|uniref:helix-turn-helix domain-containing protein n=1 Tax=Enterococcus faecium TaxID=1352 RepID=UPI00102E56E4|nr:helix-turn-helix domain-containing protein [Enterococcus faecium]MBG8111870.1 helix-turn-helix domain-containing protein [Enterococcus faecium]MDH2814593.1 helix-turn-helix domain-containing protein [Enterococcus faecium]TAP66414.1 helix-turn-helix domain-containing protein [Enterococcus faecium]TAQ03768.1 helix-turn-helix domain-containing protein [Enterococcus faecium]HAQ2175310.1 helix-turn-helix domain-containing protein [Enterococcus faecium]
MTEHRSYYAIIPANVRYDKRLKPNTKLLYGEITALCNERGFCWAGNEYFADLYGVNKETISRWVSDLIKFGYLNREIIYKEGTNQIINRYLRINQYPIDEKVKDNNTSINNTFNNTKEYIRELPPSKKSKAKPVRHKYGEYKNVLLSDEQMEKLKTEFPNDYQERIERLSEYCESSGKTYKNYLATIRSWARKEKSEPKNASSGYKRTGRREKLPEWAIDQEAYLKKKALERANRQSKAPF